LALLTPLGRGVFWDSSEAASAIHAKVWSLYAPLICEKFRLGRKSKAEIFDIANTFIAFN